MDIRIGCLGLILSLVLASGAALLASPTDTLVGPAPDAPTVAAPTRPPSDPCEAITVPGLGPDIGGVSMETPMPLTSVNSGGAAPSIGPGACPSPIPLGPETRPLDRSPASVVLAGRAALDRESAGDTTAIDRSEGSAGRRVDDPGSSMAATSSEHGPHGVFSRRRPRSSMADTRLSRARRR